MSFATFLADPDAVARYGDWWVYIYLTDTQNDLPPVDGDSIRFNRFGTSSPGVDIVVDNGSLGADDTIHAHTKFDKRLISLMELNQSIWSADRTGPRIGGKNFPSWGSLVLNNRDGGLDVYRPGDGARYIWAGRRCAVYYFDRRDPAGTIGKVFDGIMDDPEYNGLTDVTVKLKGREAVFDQPLTTYKFRGTPFMAELLGDMTISYGTPAAADITGNMTGEFGWLWLEALPTVDRRVWGYVASTNFPWRLGILTTGAVVLACTISGGVQTAISDFLLTAHHFYHISFVIEGRNVTFEIWDDDAQFMYRELHSNAFTVATRDARSGGSFQLRTDSDATLQPWVAEQRVWNVIRTAQELEDNRYGQIPDAAIPSSLKHYARFDDGTGATVLDHSATGANGTASGAGAFNWICPQEGGPELAGQLKPDLWGQRPHIKPVLVDPNNSGYMVAGGGRIEEIVSVAEGGDTDIIDDGDAASFRAYLFATVADGHQLTYLQRGLFRRGSAPTLPLSVEAKGYHDAWGYSGRPVNIIYQIITGRGPKLVSPDDINTDQLDNLDDVAFPTIGVPLPEHKTIADVLTYITDTIGASWGYWRASSLFYAKLFTAPVGSPTYRLDQRDIISLKPKPPKTLTWKVEILFRVNDVVLNDASEVAETIRTAVPNLVHEYTQPWQIATATDQTVRDQYPGDASTVLTIKTAHTNREEAQAEADRRLAIYKVPREGWEVEIRAKGRQMTVTDTTSLALVTQRGVERMGLDGSNPLVALSMKDAKQKNTITLSLWG